MQKSASARYNIKSSCDIPGKLINPVLKYCRSDRHAVTSRWCPATWHLEKERRLRSSHRIYISPQLRLGDSRVFKRVLSSPARIRLSLITLFRRREFRWFCWCTRRTRGRNLQISIYANRFSMKRDNAVNSTDVSPHRDRYEDPICSLTKNEDNGTKK